MGRPSDFTEELADRFLEHIAEGGSFRGFCAQPNTPAMATLFRWLRDRDDFREHYAYAKEAGCHGLAEQIIEIADNDDQDWEPIYAEDGALLGIKAAREVVNRSRLRVDARKWHLSKLFPKKYGDAARLEVETPQGITFRWEGDGEDK